MARPRSTKKEATRSLDSQLTDYSAAAQAVVAADKATERAPSRLAVYTGAAGAALASAVSTEAAIQYTPANITMNVGHNQTNITMGGGGGWRFWWAGGGTNTGLIQTIGGVHATTGAANELKNFSAGQTISTGAGNWTGANGYLFNDPDNTAPAAAGKGLFWNGNTGYVGVRFNPGAGNRYGWIQVDSIAPDFSQYHISGYAYEDSGGTIKAGEMPVPEPSTIALALLASGAAGVMASRRKKILKGRK